MIRAVRRRLAAVVRSGLPVLASPRVMRYEAGARFWRGAVAAPGIPDGLRAELADRVKAGLLQVGRPSDAATVFSRAARHVRSPALRADLLIKSVGAELTTGRLPTELQAAWAAELARTDALLHKGQTRRAAVSLGKALSLGFHRGVHFDGLSSPLAEDPAGFLGPLRQSQVARTLNARRRSTPAAPRPRDRPMRLLIATWTNDNFLREIRQRYEQSPDVEVRFVDLAADPLRKPLGRRSEPMLAHLLGAAGSEYGDQVEHWLRPHLDWADTLFIDWCVAAAVLFTMLDPGRTRIVVRLHSYELFTAWPHLAALARVDDLIVVSRHMRALALAALPQLSVEGAPRLSVIANAMDLPRYRRPKSAESRFNLGLVGVGSVAKDVRWAIDVLRALRERDGRYRLLLIGEDLDPEASASARRYHELVARDLADLEPSGAVRRLGRTDDVPAALVDVGVILSSSVRESFHCALVEGAASGAVPVVRDWPFFARWDGGARGLFPADWVVDTPAQAADRILATTGSDAAWRETGQAAAEHALATWDWTVTRRQFDELLLGSDETLVQRGSDETLV